MFNTMQLLEAATNVKPIPEWTRSLSLSEKALYNAQYRGHLSPSIAFSIAEELGLDADAWGLIAAAESEKDSACAERMKKRLAVKLGARKRTGGNEGIRTLDEAQHPILP